MFQLNYDVFIFVLIFSISNAKNTILPNLPFGEYYVVFHTALPCESTTNHKIQFNLYLSKKSSNFTELKGNITYLVDLDDSIFLELNMASWSLRGGWKDNFAVYKTPEGCTNLKKVVGEAWSMILKSVKIPTNECPIRKGAYVLSSGFDVNNLRKNNLPKVFFYGKFKGTVKLMTKEGNLLGCLTSEMNILRPWEK